MTANGRSVGVVGGGLAGLAAAVALCERGFRVELFEAKRQLGGRAGSFVDPETGELVDHCQHVAMGCCTEFLALLRRTGVEHLFRRDDVLHFLSPSGKCHEVQAFPWLPAPLHLLPSMWRLDYLSWREKFGIARALLALVRYGKRETATSTAIGPWLRARGQSARAIERFWQVVLVSALGENLDRASIAAARKVFLDGFLTTRGGYQLYVPQAPLGKIYELGIARWLRDRGVQIHTGMPVSVAAGARALQLADGKTLPFDFIVVATSWKTLTTVVPRERFPEFAPILDVTESLAGSPITSVHVWLDRPVTSLPHVVVIDRLAQWVFAHGASYYQVVISAAHDLATRSRDDVLREVVADLAAIFPPANDARVMRWRMLTQPDAVFSYRPGLDALRPSQSTPIDTLFLAGDYTATGWPSTMEGAVRSGNLVAESIAQSLARRE